MKKNFPIKRFLPWFVLVAIALWLASVVGELRDALQLENEGVVTIGRMESPEWSIARGSRSLLFFDGVWMHDGHECRRRFKVPYAAGAQLADDKGHPLVTHVEIRYVPARPEVAGVTVSPPDPFWVSLILAGVGFCVFCGVMTFLYHEWSGRRKDGIKTPVGNSK